MKKFLLNLLYLIQKFQKSIFKNTKCLLKIPFKLYTAAFILLIMCFLIPNGCKNKFSKLLSYSVQIIPKNLDPQTANDANEITVINNVFDGLYKRNLNGSFSLNAASNVQKSSDLTKYIFTIKNNINWKFNPDSDEMIKLKKQFERPLSAKDFEFAFKRLLNPNNNAPFATNYYFIKNAQLVHEGKLPANQLGIYAQNNQLTLELQHPTPNLEELLSLAPAMPCNEEFFKFTKGRYGLNLDSILCNGKFYIHQWPQNQKNRKLRLRVNKNNPESANVQILGVNMSQRPNAEAFKLINKNEIDSAMFSSIDFDLNQINANSKNLFQNSTCGIIFNQNNAIFSNEKIRQALAMTTDHEKIKKSLNSNNMTKAYGIIPNSVTIAQKNYRQLTNNTSALPEYDPEKAKVLFNQGLNEIQPKTNKNIKSKKNTKATKLNLNNFSILVQEKNYDIINEILQSWQKNFNLYLKIQICKPDEYFKNLKDNNFDCALVTLENDFNSPSCLLNQFACHYSENLTNLPLLLKNAASQSFAQNMAAAYLEAEKAILFSGAFIPIYHPTKAFVLSKKFKDVIFIGSCTQLYFEYAKPKK